MKTLAKLALSFGALSLVTSLALAGCGGTKKSPDDPHLAPDKPVISEGGGAAGGSGGGGGSAGGAGTPGKAPDSGGGATTDGGSGE
ncbi:MAG: hypothetical protein GF320_08935 [Armatimonadia bacterium]|nr:hypothetical protein [Armatimonadia bacterium]